MHNAGSLQVIAQSARHEQTEHAKIADQRPPGVGECGRSIAFDQPMRRPGKRIAGKWHCQERPSIGDDANGQERNRQTGPYIVKRARGPLAMLAQVKRPEFAISGEPFRHGQTPAVILLSKAAKRSLPHLLKASQRFFVVLRHDHNLD